MHNEAAYTVEGTYEGKFDCTYRSNSKNRLDFCILGLNDYFTESNLKAIKFSV